MKFSWIIPKQEDYVGHCYKLIQWTNENKIQWKNENAKKALNVLTADDAMMLLNKVFSSGKHCDIAAESATSHLWMRAFWLIILLSCVVICLLGKYGFLIWLEGASGVVCISCKVKTEA